MMRPTAVEWLVTELNQELNYIPITQWDRIRDLVQRAKAMEKEQMVRAFHAACKQDYALEEIREWAENYISSTYKNSKTPPGEHCKEA